MKMFKVVMSLFGALLLTSTSAIAGGMDCYTKAVFKTKHKVYKTDISYDITVTFCKTAVSGFDKAKPEDRVLILEAVKKTGDKSEGAYVAHYVITASTKDKENEKTYDVNAVLNKEVKKEVAAPGELDVAKLSLAFTYGESNSMMLRDKNGKYFFEAAEEVEDGEWY